MIDNSFHQFASNQSYPVYNFILYSNNAGLTFSLSSQQTKIHPVQLISHKNILKNGVGEVVPH